MRDVGFVVVGVGVPAVEGDFDAADAGTGELNGSETAATELGVAKVGTGFGGGLGDVEGGELFGWWRCGEWSWRRDRRGGLG